MAAGVAILAAGVRRCAQRGAGPAAVQGATAPSIQAYTTGRCVSPIHMGRTIGQVSVQVCQGEQPGEDVELVWAAGDSHIAIKMSIFTENPVEEAEEHGYKEEPTLRSDMDTKAEGHGEEPSQEEQHWLENYNLDDQE
jgi:hypothetical protein